MINSWPFSAFIAVILFSSCASKSDECSIECCQEKYDSVLGNPGIPVDLPKNQAIEPIEQGKIAVFVTSDNDYFVGDISASKDNIESLIMAQVNETGDSLIILQGDKTSDWEANVKVIDIAKTHFLKVVIKTDSK